MLQWKLSLMDIVGLANSYVGYCYIYIEIVVLFQREIE